MAFAAAGVAAAACAVAVVAAAAAAAVAAAAAAADSTIPHTLGMPGMDWSVGLGTPDTLGERYSQRAACC